MLICLRIFYEESEAQMNRAYLKLYAITDRSWLGGQTLYEQVELALKGGITMLQFREKGLKNLASKDLCDPTGAAGEWLEEAVRLKELCHSYQVPFIVNDYVELAKRIDADGVHIGQSDMGILKARQILGKDKIIGVTAKTVEQAKQAEKDGADYLGSGAVFGTSTKTDAKPMDLALLQEICESVSIPVTAIGGIDATNAALLAGRKMAGIAVVSGIFAQPDIEQAAKELLGIVNHF